jgi:hypothetical protein
VSKEEVRAGEERAEPQQQAAAGRGGVGSTGRPARQRWRTIVAVLLMVIACVLAPLAVVAVWANNQVTNTDRYVRTMAPLAQDPSIQNALADQITAQIFSYIDIKGLTTQAADALATQGLNPALVARLQSFAGPAASGIQSFTRDEVGKLVQSQAFANAWVQANRVAHAGLVKALTGQGGGSVTVNNDTVTLNLAPLIAQVKQQLEASGFTLAGKIPQVNASFVLFRSAQVGKVRSGVHLLNVLGIWLPVILLVLFAVGVFVAKNHRRALIGAGLGLAAAMVVLALGLAIFRSVYLGAVPASVLPHDAAAVLYDTIVRFLRLGLRSVLVLGLVVALGAYLTGPSAAAVRSRQAMAHGIDWLRGGAASAGFRTGPVGSWVYAHKRWLRIGAVVAAGLALVFWSQPTGKVVIGLAVLLLIALALIEFLGRPPEVAVTTPTS